MTGWNGAIHSLLYVSIMGHVYIDGSASQDFCTKDSCKDPVFIGNFHIPTVPVPRLPITDEKALDRLKNGLPVILTDTKLFTTDETWDLNNLERLMGASQWQWQVFNGPSRRFLYHGSDMNCANYKWTPAYKSTHVKFLDFVKQFREIDKAANSSRMYMQAGLYEGAEGNAKYHIDNKMLNLIATTSESMSPGGTPWFYIGMRDVYTPMHFDYHDHIVAQIYGHKRWILVGPEHYGNMYPYPMSSPYDRNSRVHMEHPDYTQFPKFKDVTGFEAILRPGDVLFAPTMWWHLVESEHNSETVSVSIDQGSKNTEFYNTFRLEQLQRFETKKDASVSYWSKEHYNRFHKQALKMHNKKENEVPYFKRPDSPSRQVHVKRVVEQMIAESVGNYRKVGQVLSELYEGRFDNLELNKV